MTKEPTALQPVASRPKLADEVTETLRQAILSGRYAEGQHLGLEELALQMGVSVMPVRESLLNLSHEGLVEALPRRGFRAKPLNDRDLEDLFELHAFLSGSLGARAALTISEDDIDSLYALHADFEGLAARKMTERVARQMHEANTRFHRIIHRAAEGDRLRWFLRLTSRLVRQDSYEVTPGWVEATLIDHPQIIAALKARDVERTRELITRHFRRGADLSGMRRSPKTASVA